MRKPGVKFIGIAMVTITILKVLEVGKPFMRMIYYAV